MVSGRVEEKYLEQDNMESGGKNGERKGRKHLACREGKGKRYWERENIWSEEEKKNREGKEGKYLGEGK